MSYENRLALYQEMEELRKHPLLVYITSFRVNASAQMASDAIPFFAKQIAIVPQRYNDVDILIVSNGGDPTVSWRVISMLRERFKTVGVILPYAAYSAATLVALGADEIIMHPFSNLGPVDPQLTQQKRAPGAPGQGEEPAPTRFGAEDLRHFLDFVRSDVGISDQEQLERAFELVCKEVGAISIGVAKRSSYLALSMGEKLLALHMKDQNKAKAIAEALNRSFYHHGYPVGRREAKEIGLPVVKPDPGVEGCMWRIWESVEDEMDCNRPFNLVEVVMNDPNVGALLSQVPQVQIPSNLPPPILQQAYQNILNQIQVVRVEPVKYELFQATLESANLACQFRTQGRISAARLPDMQIQLGVVPTSQGWIVTKSGSN